MHITFRKTYVVICCALVIFILQSCGGGGEKKVVTQPPSKPIVVPPVVVEEPLQLSPDKLPDPALPIYGSAEWAAAVDASRFLSQASFGATAKQIDYIVKNGNSAWLDQQFLQEQTMQLKQLDRRLIHFGFMPEPPYPYFDDENGKSGTWERTVLRSDIWWETVVWGKDQLRQRVAFALSQILVVSQIGAGEYARERGFANYHDILARQAFGNYRELLLEISLNPIMGIYLSSVNNQKANADLRIRPDENFARELLQLFSIGLNQLNQDGSYVLTNDGEKISTYDQNTIKEFARVFTGWSMASTTSFGEGGLWTHHSSDVNPMKAYPAFHDSEAKTLLNRQIIPAGNTPLEDVEAAIDNIMAHQNVGPFIGKKLIQYLITSNPSPQYIERISNVFNDNGLGVKGDMEAVVRAIYLDVEARTPSTDNQTYYGKLKEWPLQAAGIWRAFKAQGIHVTSPTNSIETIRYMNGNLYEEQHAFTAPSVFNFYQSEYRPPGKLGQANLFAPEFQVFTDSNAVRQANLLSNMIYNRDVKDEDLWTDTGQNWGTALGWNNPTLHAKLNLTSVLELAAEPRALVDRLNLLLANGQLNDEDSQLIANHIGLLEDPNDRIYEAAFLIAVSPEYAIQR